MSSKINEAISCPICLDEYQDTNPVMALPCGHHVCKDCLPGIASKVCHKCRVPFQPESVSVSYDTMHMVRALKQLRPAADMPRPSAPGTPPIMPGPASAAAPASAASAAPRSAPLPVSPHPLGMGHNLSLYVLPGWPNPMVLLSPPPHSIPGLPSLPHPIPGVPPHPPSSANSAPSSLAPSIRSAPYPAPARPPAISVSASPSISSYGPDRAHASSGPSAPAAGPIRSSYLPPCAPEGLWPQSLGNNYYKAINSTGGIKPWFARFVGIDQNDNEIYSIGGIGGAELSRLFPNYASRQREVMQPSHKDPTQAKKLTLTYLIQPGTKVQIHQMTKNIPLTLEYDARAPYIAPPLRNHPAPAAARGPAVSPPGQSAAVSASGALVPPAPMAPMMSPSPFPPAGSPASHPLMGSAPMAASRPSGAANFECRDPACQPPHSQVSRIVAQGALVAQRSQMDHRLAQAQTIKATLRGVRAALIHNLGEKREGQQALENAVLTGFIPVQLEERRAEFVKEIAPLEAQQQTLEEQLKVFARIDILHRALRDFPGEEGHILYHLDVELKKVGL